ncbi:hypothetical protein ACJPQX_05680 [Vibrio vulnificus]
MPTSTFTYTFQIVKSILTHWFEPKEQTIIQY